jgi:hypothetical protein
MDARVDRTRGRRLRGIGESSESFAPSHDWGVMENPHTEKVLVIESDEGLRKSIVAALIDAGYAVSEDSSDGMRSVLGLNPAVVIMGAERKSQRYRSVRLRRVG